MKIIIKMANSKTTGLPLRYSLSHSSTNEDEDQTKTDLEVESVLSNSKGLERNSEVVRSYTSPLKRFGTPGKYNFSPFRPSTVITNLNRGNIKTTTPSVLGNLTVFQMAAQGELLLLMNEIEGKDINMQDENGFTPFLWACAYDQMTTVDFLIEKGANCHICGNQGENALLFAASKGYDRILNKLIRLGMDVDYETKSGITPLLYAAFNNHAECVKSLLEWGSDLNKKNTEGHTAMEIAVKQGHKETQQVIEKYLISLLDPS